MPLAAREDLNRVLESSRYHTNCICGQCLRRMGAMIDMDIIDERYSVVPLEVKVLVKMVRANRAARLRLAKITWP